MSFHRMIPADYTTPDTMRALDDAARVGAGLAGVFAAVAGAVLAVRRWWHRKRNRQERVLREIVADALERLDAVHAEVVAIRESQVRHLEAHAEGRTS